MEASPTSVLAVGAQGPSTPGFRVRVLIPSAELKKHGVVLSPHLLFTLSEERTYRTDAAMRKLGVIWKGRRRLKHLIRTSTEQTVFIQRQVDLFPSLALEHLATNGRRVVLDVDDAVWLETTRAAGAQPLAFIKRTSAKLQYLATRADSIIAGNENLADWLGCFNSNVTIVPSLIEPNGHPRRHHRETSTIVIGWIGSSTTGRYLLERVGALERLAASDRRVKYELLSVGAHVPAVRGMKSTSLPWSLATERQALETMDIGIMPLSDNQWTRGKCAYKALQYMAAGVPVVADDVGVSRKTVGGGGLIVENSSDWVEALRLLGDNQSMRKTLGNAGIERVETDYSVTRWAPTLARVLSNTHFTAPAFP